MKKEQSTKYHYIKSRLGLDMLQIDKELMEQPALVQDAAELCADIKESQRVAAHALDVVKAEVAARLRAPGVDKDGKETKPPSETAIDKMIVTDEEVQEARRALDQLSYDVEVTTALVSAMHDKTRMLAKTADLIGAGFITPASAYKQRRFEIREARNQREE